MQNKLVQTPLRISLLYWIMAAGWFLLAERVRPTILPIADASDSLAAYKSWFFITVTALWLYVLLRRWLSPEKPSAGQITKWFGTNADSQEQRLRAIVENLTEGLIIADADGQLSHWNRAALAMHGLRELSEATLRMSALAEIYELSSLDGQPLDPDELPLNRIFRDKMYRDYELRIRNIASGWERVFSYSGTLIQESASQSLALLTITDITERKQAEEGSDHNRAQLEAAFQAINEGLIIADMGGDLLLINQAEAAIMGFSSAEEMKKHLTFFREMFEVTELTGQVVPFEQWPLARGLRGESIADQELCLRQTATGRQWFLNFSVEPVRNERGEQILAVLSTQDITARKQAEAELEKLLEQVRSLATHLQDVREEERKHIAREIHDELGQALAGLKFDLCWLEQHLLPGNDAALGLCREKTRTMSNLITSTIEVGRKIATDLRPRVLDDLGLLVALKWQAQDFQRRTGIMCDFATDLTDLALDADRATTVFRICQEALTNVARHAQANAVTIALQVEAHWLRLEIQDDGRGISAAEINGTVSLGLLGMRERVLPLGGELHLQGQSGKGTTVTVRVPLTAD